MTLDTTVELLGTERLLAPRPEPVRSLPEREQIPVSRSRWLAAVSTGKTELWCQQPGARVRLANEVAVFLSCQGDRKWPDGAIDVCGAPW